MHFYTQNLEFSIAIPNGFHTFAANKKNKKPMREDKLCTVVPDAGE